MSRASVCVLSHMWPEEPRAWCQPPVVSVQGKSITITGRIGYPRTLASSCVATYGRRGDRRPSAYHMQGGVQPISGTPCAGTHPSHESAIRGGDRRRRGAHGRATVTTISHDRQDVKVSCRCVPVPTFPARMLTLPLRLSGQLAAFWALGSLVIVPACRERYTCCRNFMKASKHAFNNSLNFISLLAAVTLNALTNSRGILNCIETSSADGTTPRCRVALCARGFTGARSVPSRAWVLGMGFFPFFR